MSPNRRNLFVGATVLGGLIILGWMLLKFGAAPAKFFSEDSLPVKLITDRADGISEGSQVYYRGVPVGRVVNVNLVDGKTQVAIDVVMDPKSGVPANVSGTIRFAGLLGGNAQLTLELTDPVPQGKLAAGATLEAKFIGLDILPREFTQLAEDLRLTSRQFRESKLLDNLNNAIASAQKTIDSVRAIVGDEKLQANLKESIANIRTASETATHVATKMDQFSDRLTTLSTQASETITKAQGTIDKTQSHIDDISRHLTDRLGQVGKILETFQSISAKIDQGKGTAGQLVNDAKLYESLVDTSRELNATIADMKRLVEQWEQEGVTLKLK